MKKPWFLVLCLGLAASGCGEEEVSVPSGDGVVFLPRVEERSARDEGGRAFQQERGQVRAPEDGRARPVESSGRRFGPGSSASGSASMFFCSRAAGCGILNTDLQGCIDLLNDAFRQQSCFDGVVACLAAVTCESFSGCTSNLGLVCFSD